MAFQEDVGVGEAGEVYINVPSVSDLRPANVRSDPPWVHVA
jgi:hypothetical protein